MPKEQSLPYTDTLQSSDMVRVLIGGSLSENILWPQVLESVKTYTDSLYLPLSALAEINGLYINPITVDTYGQSVLSLTDQVLGLQAQAQNKVWAGPASGSARTPTFRTLVAADLPAMIDKALIAGSNTQIQFNDGGTLGANAGFVFNKVTGFFGVGTPSPASKFHAASTETAWAQRNIVTAGNPLPSLTYVFGTSAADAAIRGISNTGMWGLLGFSRASDISAALSGAMLTIGMYGNVINDSSANAAYGMYTEARKTATNSTASTAAAEFAIMNAMAAQYDVTPSSNPGGATVGLAVTSGATYDGVTYHDASVGLLIAPVGARFRRGIVIIDGAMTDLSGSYSKWVAMALPGSSRIAWHNDDNCIMGTDTVINTLIANDVITSVSATGIDMLGHEINNSGDIILNNTKFIWGKTAAGALEALFGIDAGGVTSVALGVPYVDIANASGTVLLGTNATTTIGIGTNSACPIVLGSGSSVTNPVYIKVSTGLKNVTIDGNGFLKGV
jgi:hypothetical protein